MLPLQKDNIPMMKHFFKYAVALYIIVSLTTACKSNAPTADQVLETLKSSQYFTASFFAPMEIGRQVLTEEDHKNPQSYINSKYKQLLGAGLIKVETIQKNAWRTVLSTSITENGKQYLDPRRSSDEHAYVMVCNLVPSEIIKIDTLGVASDTIIYSYKFIESEVTPFGEFLGYQTGKQHMGKALAIRSGRGWITKPFEL